MKHLPNIAGALLGLMFIAFGAMFLLDLIPKDAQPPPGRAQPPRFSWEPSPPPTICIL